MQNLKILNSKERKNIINLLKEQYDCELDNDYEIFINPNNRVFIMNKSFSRIDIDELRINSLGLYLGELYNKEIRLSVDGSQIIGKTAKKNILELDDEQAEKWMKGEDFEIDTELNGFVIIRNGSDFLGCGKISNKKLYNYLPKERRI